MQLLNNFYHSGQPHNIHFMADFKTRLVDEKAQLDQKIELLKSFRNSDKIDSISLDHQNLLSTQLLAMQQYSNVLEMRLQLLEKGV